MAYRSTFGEGKLYVENRESQTLITLQSSTLGQQQSQLSSFNTGSWREPPQLFQSSNSLFLKIDTAKGQTYIQVQATSIQVLDTAPSLENAKLLSLQQIELPENSSTPPLSPMQPMQPMKMGNMEMQMNPMQMRMGDMKLQMGPQSHLTKQFCPQCGQLLAEPSQRFCSSCGHQL